MNTNQSINQRIHCERPLYALRHAAHSWEVIVEGRQSSFGHELGALYVAYLLSEPPRKAVHGVALALKAREKFGQSPRPAEAFQQRVMGLEDASSVRALWRRQRELEWVLADPLEIEPVDAEAMRELEELTERLRQSPWLSCHGAERCAHAVAEAIRRFHARLAAAVDAKGKPDEVLRAFAVHLHRHLLAPSGRGACGARGEAWAPPGCFIYVPPRRVLWEVSTLESRVQSPTSKVSNPASKVRSLAFKVQGSKFRVQRFSDLAPWTTLRGSYAPASLWR